LVDSDTALLLLHCKATHTFVFHSCSCSGYGFCSKFRLRFLLRPREKS